MFTNVQFPSKVFQKAKRWPGIVYLQREAFRMQWVPLLLENQVVSKSGCIKLRARYFVWSSQLKYAGFKKDWVDSKGNFSTFEHQTRTSGIT